MFRGQALLEIGNTNIPPNRLDEFSDIKPMRVAPLSIDVNDSRGYTTLPKNIEPIKITTPTALKRDPRRVSMPNIMPMTKSNETLLQDAVIAGNITTMNSLFENGANPYYKNKKGWNVVHLAAYHNRDTVVQALIDKKVDAQATDTEGKTPLHIAAERGNKTVMKILVDCGACPHKEDQDGTTVVQIVRKSVVRQTLEKEVLEMLDDFSDLEKCMEDAAIASKEFRFRVRLCTTYLGMVLIVVTAIVRELIKHDSPSAYEFLMVLIFAFGTLIALGIPPNNVVTIRISGCFLLAMFVFYACNNTRLFFTQLLVTRHEVQDLEDDIVDYCGQNVPQLGCILKIARISVKTITNCMLVVSYFRSFRKMKGKKILDFKRAKGDRYDDSAFKVAPRAALGSTWFHFRLACAIDGVVFHFIFGIIFQAINDPDRIPFFTHEVFKVYMIKCAGQLCMVMATTPDRRHRLMAFITNKVGKRHARLATSVMAMFGRRSVKQALTLARQTFRTISFENFCKADYTSSWIKYDTTFGKTVKARLGSCDAFVSHSWSDDGSQKFEALCEWCLEFKANNGRAPQLWIDKDCIEKNSFAEDLACLPFFLSGSKKLIILAGPTYSERLWCIMEVFLFLVMGGNVSNIDVLPIEPSEKEKIATFSLTRKKKTKEFAQKIFEKIDVNSSKCEHENERQTLLGVIEAGFSSFEEFDGIMKQVFKNEKISQLLSMKEIRDTQSAKLEKTGKTKLARAENYKVHPTE